MISIQSSIIGYHNSFQSIKKLLDTEGFTLGSGYTYEHGYFDKPLDWEAIHGYRYYLRIPIHSIDGNDIDQPHTQIELGKPFVIKHEFRTNTNDPSADIGVFTSLINQFTTPIPAENHPIDVKWIQRAKKILHKIEMHI
ncbi:hypothetical protein IC619_014715 [Hazenella sp. IB182353]|uniref:YugN family protein n=1 Tax=Polycladospora coralii TaxID=2771432 RepID=UPI001745F052|nr:YugN family protein [Polycladospora coralii]MBS7531730.1 hypothetical protein [Polycladospora coralii]